MIYFEATITLAPAKLREFNQLLEQTIVPLWEKHGAKLIGSWETAVGTMNEVVDLWCFNSMDHFNEVLQAFIRDPEMRPLWPTVTSIILGEKNRLLRPLRCSPLK